MLNRVAEQREPRKRARLRIRRPRWRHVAAWAAIAGILIGTWPVTVRAATPLYWDPTQTGGTSGGGAGTWTTSTNQWYNGSSDTTWNSADVAVFGGAAGSYNVTVSSGITAAGLQFNTAGYTLSGSTLTLSGTPTIVLNNAGTTTINSALAGSSGFTLSGSTAGATLVLGGANTYTGATTITSGDILTLTGTGTNGALNSASTLTLAGGTLNYAPSGTNTQAVNGLTLNAGQSFITAAAADTLNLGTVTATANTGGTVDFGSTGSIITSTTNSSGIIGGYATFNGGATWAVANGASAITGLTTFVETSTALNTAASYASANIDVNSSQAPTAAIAPDSLRFNGASETLTLTGDNNVGSGSGAGSFGGILMTPSATGNMTITGGTYLEGPSKAAELVIQQYSTNYILTIASTVSNSGTIAASGPGTVDLTGGAASITGNIDANGPGTLSLSGIANSASYTFNSALGGGTLELTPVASGGEVTLSGNFTGTGNLVLNSGGLTTEEYKVDTGSFTMNGNLMLGGGVQFDIHDSLTSLATIQVGVPGGAAGSSAELDLNGGTTYGSSSQLITFYGDGSNDFSSGSLTNATGGTATLASNLDFGGTAKTYIFLSGGDEINLTGAFTGTAVLQLQSTGSLNITGAAADNTYSGTLTMGNASLVIGAGSSLGNGTTASTAPGLVLAAGSTDTVTATFDNTTQTLLNLSTAGTSASSYTQSIVLSGSGGTALTLIETSNTTFGASNGTYTSSISGTGTLTLSNLSTAALTLSGANTYVPASGTGTFIDGGTLLVTNTSGSATGTSPVSIGGGTYSGTLGGTGTISGPVTLSTGGTIAPSAGSSSTFHTLNLTGGLTINGGSLSFNAGGTGTQSDVIAVPGTLSIGSNPITVNINDVTAGGGISTTAPSSIEIMSYTALSGSISELTASLAGFSSVTFSASAGVVDANFTPSVNLTWSGSVNNFWNTSDANWNGGAATFAPGNNVTFGSTPTPGTITISGTVAPGSVSATNTSGTWVFTGGAINGGSLAVSGGGILELENTNTYSGTTAISNSSTLELGPSGSLNSTVSVGSGSTFGFGTGTTTAFSGSSITGAGNLAVTGSGTNLTLTTAPGYTGTTTVGAGAALTLGSSSSYSTTTTLTTDVSGSGLSGYLVINGTPRVNFNAGLFSGGGQIQVVNSGAELANTSATLPATTTGTIGDNVVLNSTVTSGANINGFVTYIAGVGSGGALTISGTISGASDVNFGNGSGGGGAGTVYLGAANTWTGTTTLNTSGTVQLGISNALPTGTALYFNTNSDGGSPNALDLHGFSQQVASLSMSGSHGEIINNGTGNSTFTISGSATTTFSGTIADGTTNTVALTLDSLNTGVLTLSGTNAYSGATTITGGTLLVTGSLGASALGGSPTSAVLVNGGTLGGTGTIAGSVTLTSGTIAPSATQSSTTYSTLTVGGLTLTSGTLDFNIGASNTHNDVITVTGSSSNALTINGGTLNFTNGAIPAGGGSYDIINYAGSTFTGNINSLTLGSVPFFTETLSTTISGQIDVVFTAVAQTWTNGTTDNQWNTTSTDSANWTSGAFVNGESVTFDSTHATPGIVNVTDTVSGVAPGTVMVTNAGGTTYTFTGGPISGTSLAVSGGGTLVLENTNTYSSGVSITSGTLEISTGGSLNSTVSVGSGSTFGFEGGSGFAFSGSSITGAGNLSVTDSGTNLTLSTAPGYTGTTSVGSGATLTLDQSSTNATLSGGVNGTNTINGNLVVVNALKVNFGGGSTLNTFSGTGQVQVQASGTFLETSSGGAATLGTNVVLNSTSAAPPFVTYIGATNGNTFTITGAISGTSDVLFKSGSGDGTGAGVVVIDPTGAANSYTGNSTIDNGGIVRLGVANALPTTTNLIFGVSSTAVGALDLNGVSQQVESLSSAAATTIGGIINTSSSTGTLVIAGSALTTYAGPIGANSAYDNFNGSSLVTNNNIALVLASGNTGTLVLTYANTYSGGTTVNGGTLEVSGSTVEGGSPVTITSSPIGTGTLTLANGATLSDNGSPQTLANALSLSGTVTFATTGGGTLTFDPTGLTTPTVVALLGDTTMVVNNTTTINESIGGAHNLTVEGSGMLVFGTTNTYSGTTTINNGGTLAISTGGNLSSSSGLVFASGGTLDANGNITYGGTASGTGNIDVAGGDALTLSGTVTANITATGTGVLNIPNLEGTYNTTPSSAGNITLNGGTVNFTSGGTDSGNITVTSHTSGIVNVPAGDTLTLSGTLTKTDATLMFTGGAGSSLVINGQITGSSATFDSDIIFSTNTLLNNSNNNYYGNTYINENATVTSGVLNAMPTSTVLTLGNADTTTGAFDLAGNSQTLAGLLTATGSPAGSNIVTDTGGVATLYMNNSGSDAFNGTISGSNLTLTMQGAGNLVLGGSNSYGGGTNITSGTITVSADNNLGATSGAVTFTGGGTLAVTTGYASEHNFVFGSGGGNIAVSGGQTFTASGQWTSTGGGVTLTGAGTVQLDAGTYGSSENPLSVTAANGSLTGTATVLGNVTIASGGTIEPGTSTPGVMTFTNGGLATGTGTLNPGGDFAVNLTNVTGSPGTNWNELVVSSLVAGSTGGNSLSSAHPFDISIANFNTAGFNNTQGYTWDIIQGAGASSLAGDFSLNTANLPNEAGYGTFSIQTIGNTVALEYSPSAVPEPGSMILAGLAALCTGGMGWRQRRRRQQAEAQQQADTASG